MTERRAVLAMASTASAGLVLFAIASLAARRLSGAELGLFFSFLSFGALVQLGDFGLSYASLQTAGQLAGTGRLHELPSLARRVASWNLAATAVASIVVAILGSATFSSGVTGIAWAKPWAVYLAAVFANQLTMPRISLREGSGKVAQMWALRLVQEWTAGAACLLALHFGAGLYSLAMLPLVRALVAGVWLGVFDRLASSGADAYSLRRWMAEVWPFQWKIGVSGLSGFLIFRAFSPLVLLEKGAVAAGQFGLAIAFMNLLIAVTTAWPLSQAAHYAALYASGGHARLRREFPRMFVASSLIAALAAASLAFVLWKARAFGIPLAQRLPDTLTTTLILATAVIHHIVACFAVFLRAEGREPLLVASVAGSIATILAVWLAAHVGTLVDIAAVNLACTAVGIPVVLLLFRSRMLSSNAIASS
jgi:hypothetical protein